MNENACVQANPMRQIAFRVSAEENKQIRAFMRDLEEFCKNQPHVRTGGFGIGRELEGEERYLGGNPPMPPRDDSTGEAETCDNCGRSDCRYPRPGEGVRCRYYNDSEVTHEQG